VISTPYEFAIYGSTMDVVNNIDYSVNVTFPVYNFGLSAAKAVSVNAYLVNSDLTLKLLFGLYVYVGPLGTSIVTMNLPQQGRITDIILFNVNEEQTYPEPTTSDNQIKRSILFDGTIYGTYPTQLHQATHNQSKRTMVIVLASIGGILGFLLIALLVGLVIVRKLSQKRRSSRYGTTSSGKTINEFLQYKTQLRTDM